MLINKQNEMKIEELKKDYRNESKEVKINVNKNLEIMEKGYEFLLDNTTLNTLPYKDTLIQNVITKIKEQKIQTLKEDTLGVLFEKFIREEERKDLGQFYTPQEIVDYIVNFLNPKSTSKILDPTCGCGVFLITAYNFLRQTNKEAINNLYGVDLNDSATKITRINLWLRNGRNDKSLEILEKNIKAGNSIVEDENLDYLAFNWKSQFSEILDNGGFDFIIGNPPYVTLKNGSDYDLRESVFSQIANGSTNAASLVIAKSYELLKNNGIMAFVLPKTLLRVNSYSKLRDFLLDNTKILHIYNLGNYFKDVRGEQIVIFIEKTNNREEINKNNVLIRFFEKNRTLSKQKEFLVPQELFRKHNNFLMFENIRYYNLIENINAQGEKLENFANIFRGITISPHSNLITKSKTNNTKPIIKGKNISKFKYDTTYFIRKDKITDKSQKFSQFNKNKIILQNIFSSEAGIIAAIDKSGNINFDTVTNITLKDSRLNEKYLFGLLNSKLLNFFLIYAIYNKSRLTMHTDKVYLGKLPVKVIPKEKQKKVIALVSELEKAEEKKQLLKQIDEEVYKIYNINKTEQSLVEQSLKKIMSAKSIW